ncbi:MAG: hypothetical protein IKL88_04675 [Erysipelotrichales bacterium]|nr:hypothetical protein [Erysipelotrichales bacterium]
MPIEQKLRVLKKIASAFERAHITWAVGASVLLYFKEIVPSFNDLDLLIHMKDIEKAKKILLQMGILKLSQENTNFKTKVFLELVVDAVEVDVIGGFAIVHDGICHDCSLLEEQIMEYVELQGHQIPLQSIELWKQYYYWMGREKKVNIIEEALHRNSAE